MDMDEKRDLRGLMEEVSASTEPMTASIELTETVGDLTKTVRIEVKPGDGKRD